LSVIQPIKLSVKQSLPQKGEELEAVKEVEIKKIKDEIKTTVKG